MYSTERPILPTTKLNRKPRAFYLEQKLNVFNGTTDLTDSKGEEVDPEARLVRRPSRSWRSRPPMTKQFVAEIKLNILVRKKVCVCGCVGVRERGREMTK